MLAFGEDFRWKWVGLRFPAIELGALCPLTGEAVEVGSPGKIGVYQDASGNPTMFPDRNTAIAAFRDPFPGEGGQRNELRGPGFFGIDAGLRQGLEDSGRPDHQLCVGSIQHYERGALLMRPRRPTTLI